MWYSTCALGVRVQPSRAWMNAWMHGCMDAWMHGEHEDYTEIRLGTALPVLRALRRLHRHAETSVKGSRIWHAIVSGVSERTGGRGRLDSVGSDKPIRSSTCGCLQMAKPPKQAFEGHGRVQRHAHKVYEDPLCTTGPCPLFFRMTRAGLHLDPEGPTLPGRLACLLHRALLLFAVPLRGDAL